MTSEVVKAALAPPDAVGLALFMHGARARFPEPAI